LRGFILKYIWSNPCYMQTMGFVEGIPYVIDHEGGDYELNIILYFSIIILRMSSCTASERLLFNIVVPHIAIGLIEVIYRRRIFHLDAYKFRPELSPG
jgi:hypothetical protein